MIVDTHTHVIADDETRYPLDPRPGVEPWFVEHAHTVDALLALMDDAGVDRAVVVQAVGAYRHDNRYVLDAVDARRDRCTSVVCIDLAAPDAPAELRRLVDEHGARGLRWWAIDGHPFAEPRALWDEIGRLGLPVVATLLDDRLDELLELVPSLPPVPIAVDHCAFVSWGNGVPDALAAVRELPNVSVKVSSIALDMMAEHGDVRDVVADLAATIGGDRLLWGSDFSQTNDRPYAELVELARHASSKLGDDDRAGFLGENALRIWPELRSARDS